MGEWYENISRYEIYDYQLKIDLLHEALDKDTLIVSVPGYHDSVREYFSDTKY